MTQSANQLQVNQLIHLTFLKMNRWYFNDSVPVPNRVAIIENPDARFSGLCTRYVAADNTVAFRQLTFANWFFRYHTTGAVRNFEDYMLHEMLHLKIGCSTHQEDAWIAELERITPLLELTVPKTWTRFQLKSFPHSLTDSSYYQSDTKRKSGATMLFANTEFLEYQLGVKSMSQKMARTLAHGTKLLIDDVNSGRDDGFLDIRLTKNDVKIRIVRESHGS